MAILKGSFTYAGDSNLAPLENIELKFKLPKFKYEQNDKLFRQIKLKPTNSAISLSLSKDSYNTPYSGNLIVGENLDMFISWFSMVWNYPRSLDDLKLDIPYSIVGPNRVLLGKGSVSAFFFIEDFFPEGSRPHTPDKFELTLDFLASTLFLINTKEFYLLLSDIEVNTETSDTYLLEIIKAVRKCSKDRAEQHNLNDEEIKRIVLDLQKRGRDISITSETVEKVIDHFAKLTSFPIEIDTFSEVKVAGNFNINTAASNFPRSELAYYHLSIETTVHSVADDALFQMLRVDWDDDKTDPIVAPLEFKPVENQQPLIVSSVVGSIIVRVAGFDGTTLWRQSYEPDSAELEHIEIVIDSHLPGKLEGDELESNSSSRRILGQVLTTNKSLPVSGLTVVLQAKETEGSVWRIVSAGETHGSGYFSLKYPKGKFVAAQAIVSVSPNSAVDIDIVESEIENETLSGDFLYLMLDLDELPDEANSKCGKISRLPDNADLIASDEYTQDLGQCVNITTPNRSLREYNYNAIVRISDPDVANYTLERIPDPDNEGQFNYKLSGGDQVIERTPVNLSNPIRWQDAPEASDNLSFYQSVTVATGHILFFKSVFKADGYSKGDCVYSLPLAPGQKKQIVSYDVANTLEASESQQLSQGESLSAGLFDDRTITNDLSGGISETLSGQSSATTAGVSAGLGLAGTYGFISGTLGVAGGYANSNSSASQSGSRNITQHFDEKLKQSLIQNSESYRALNASVVTTVKEGQEYTVTTEVVSNHNHCHSVTMMYFEVLRHYAICQELSDVQECLFVPMLLTEFTRENISKWKDILATNLLPIPSNTYLQPVWMFQYIRQHPFVRAFDANERKKTNYTRVDFPDGTYANDDITSITGEFQLRINLPRPRTSFDRILSLPVVTKTVKEGSISVKGAVIGAAIGSILGGPAGEVIGGVIGGSSTAEKEILAKEAIFNAFFILDANYESVPPAKAIRINEITEVKPVNIDGETKFIPFFANDEDKEQWTTYANILNERANTNYSDVYEMLNSLFSGRLISEWDTIFYKDIAPYIVEQLTESIKFSSNDASISLDLTRIDQYTKGDRRIRVRVAGDSASSRNEIKEITIISESDNIKKLESFAKVNIGKVRLNYTTEHFDGYIINRYIGNDLLDGVKFLTPLTIREKRNPKKEDGYLVEELLQHLNSNLEHYNKVLWRNLDPDRRYMLLDGFNIQIYDRSGGPIGYRSLASVIKNDLITITGNSLVFPVADGFNVSQSLIVEETENEIEETQPSLLDRYRPTREVEPYRLSVPTRGVYMESVMGKCDACEDVKKNSSQDWDKFRTEEPTAISPVTTPTPSRTDWHAIWAQFAQPLVELQTARDAPAPGAGLSGLSDVLANSDAFRDLTGLEGNQANVIKTYLSNQENAKAFAEMAKNMAMQQHNTENSDEITQKAEDLDDGTPEGKTASKEAKKAHVQQMIDGGASAKESKQNKDSSKNKLTTAAAKRIEEGELLDASRVDPDGTVEEVKSSGLLDALGDYLPLDKKNKTGPYTRGVPAIAQSTSANVATALQIVQTFAGAVQTEKWKLQRADVAAGLSKLINQPGTVDQSNLNVCGPAAFFRVWIERDPVAFATFATRLYNTGKSAINNYDVDPSDGLIKQDYAKLLSKHRTMPEPATWLVMSAIRDQENAGGGFEGTPSESYDAATLPGDIKKWLDATGLYSDVDNDTTWTLYFNEDADYLLNLSLSSNTDIILFTSGNLASATGWSRQVERGIETDSTPNHIAVLKQVQARGSDLFLHIWSWGNDYKGLVSKSFIEDHIWGAVIAKV